MNGSTPLQGVREEIRAYRETLRPKHMFVAVHDQEVADLVRVIGHELGLPEEYLDIYVQPSLLRAGEVVVGQVPPLMFSPEGLLPQPSP